MKINQEKGTKKCVIKRKLKVQDYKNCLEAAQIENKINHLKKIKLIWIVLKNLQNIIKTNIKTNIKNSAKI